MLNNLNDIALFVAVVKAKSFRKAADVLDMPTSTLSRRVSHLEKSIGIRLLHRTTRQIELTELGRTYFERCQGIIAQAQSAHEELSHAAESPTGLLRLSMVEEFAADYIIPYLPEFRRMHPGIRFEFDINPRRANLISDSVDIAFRMGQITDSGLIARRLAVFKVGLYASPGYLKKAPKLKSPADLAAHSCLQLAALDFPLVKGSQRTVHKIKSPAYASNSMSLLKSIALRDAGIAMISVPMAQEAVQRGELVRVLPDWCPPEVPVYALTETRLLPAKTRTFLDYLQDKLKS
ncbi:LysR family transcriptional regulator [Arenimonas sp. GDDSR-1]|uniref:LysR family transcriptional regulator n=1 Tax=Arenimonas sp. GDDSR-1 TaxID=2950125 RepID=UPI0026315314|nr:LysR family transcriptional regulator [Arenimonas sp. GDDSR-1]